MADPVTIREVLEGYRYFNAWELQKQNEELPKLTIEESLRQFFELCAVARKLAPDAEQIFLADKKADWIARHERMKQAARVMSNGSPITSPR